MGYSTKNSIIFGAVAFAMVVMTFLALILLTQRSKRRAIALRTKKQREREEQQQLQQQQLELEQRPEQPPAQSLEQPLEQPSEQAPEQRQDHQQSNLQQQAQRNQRTPTASQQPTREHLFDVPLTSRTKPNLTRARLGSGYTSFPAMKRRGPLQAELTTETGTRHFSPLSTFMVIEDVLSLIHI